MQAIVPLYAHTTQLLVVYNIRVMQQQFFQSLSDSAVQVAPRLLGCMLVRQIGNIQLTGRIVETEAYEEFDEASHSNRGKTARNQVMFGAPGHLYVYFTYGMHFCCNVVTGPVGNGSAVLIRAIEPVHNIEQMSLHRSGVIGTGISNGPAKLCQALAVNAELNDHDLRQSPFRLVPKPPLPAQLITTATRIGIRKAVQQPWRFYITGNPYVSIKNKVE